MVENGRNCLFWYDNWSPYGKQKDYLGRDARLTSGIRPNATLDDMWFNGQWRLPPARSEPHVNLQIYLSTLQLTDSADTNKWYVNVLVSNSYSRVKFSKSLKIMGPELHGTRLFGSHEASLGTNS